MTRSLSIVPFSLLVATAAACGSSGGDQTATFTGKSDLQLERTILAATDGDVVFASLVASSYSSVPDGTASCPKVVTTGNEVDVTGGCTTDDGTKITGSAKLVGVPGLFSGSAAASSFSMTFDQLSVNGADGVLAFDGSIDGNAGTLTSSLEDSVLGIGAHVDMDVTCGSDGQCAVGDSATIDVDGVGAATVTGTWAGDDSSMAVTIKGSETLTLSAGSGCIDYVIGGGASGRFCDGSGSN
jgi:hypothetical protein